MFVTPALARRIERAEAEVTRAVVASARHAPDVWLRPVTEPEPVRASGVDVQRVGAVESWRTTTIEAVACLDGTGVPVDQLSRKTIEVAIDDVLEAAGFDRYVASVDGVVAGAASMFVHGGIALLTGSATLPHLRRRGVQTALIAARLDAARVGGAELAAITTPPASRSGANAARHGFALGYTRAILVGRERRNP
jgi:GNAT superfamily N-acetyltransferase